MVGFAEAFPVSARDGGAKFWNTLYRSFWVIFRRVQKILPCGFFLLAFFGVGSQNLAKILENFDYLCNIHNIIDQD